MTNSGDGDGRWPFDEVDRERSSRPIGAGRRAGPGAGPGAPDDPTGARRSRAARRRRPPLWALIAIGVAVLAVVVAVVVALTNRSGADEVADPETVTLAVPTPTVDPIAREGGTEFQQALPSTVLAFALTEIVDHEPLLLAGALEAYQLGYTDGAQDLVLYAGQWRDAAGAEAAFDQVLAAAGLPAADAEADTDAATDTATGAATAGAAPEPEQGTVEVDGQPVGRYLFVERADGTGSLWWTNTTVMLQIDGPAGALRDVYTAFPL